MSVVEVNTSGPIFDGRERVIINRYCRSVETTIGDIAVNRVRSYLGSHFRYDQVTSSHGYYQSHIRTDRQAESVVVTDDQVVYGPWLEGVGTRNYPVTRFRGYHAFRMIGQSLEGVAGDIAEQELQFYMGELNGI